MKQQLIDDLRKQGYSRIADLLEAEQDAPIVPPAAPAQKVADEPAKKKAK